MEWNEREECTLTYASTMQGQIHTVRSSVYKKTHNFFFRILIRRFYSCEGGLIILHPIYLSLFATRGIRTCRSKA